MAATILLADDNPNARRMGTAYLEDLGYAVRTAADGPAAWDELERLYTGQDGAPAQTPALILADAGLPGCSGIELCRRVKARPEWRHIPVLILVGALAPVAAGSLAEADGVLRKPLSSAGLQRWLQKTPQELLVLAVREAASGDLASPTP